MKISLADLQPQEAQFSLSEYPGKVFTLKKLSLAVNIWLERKFTPEELRDIFSNQKMGGLSQIAYYLLKDKETFKTLKSFREGIVTQQDRVAIITAMIKTVGVAQPLIDKLTAEEEAKKKKVKSTGLKSST